MVTVFELFIFDLVEYLIWYPEVCVVYFFHFTVNPLDLAVTLEIEVFFGLILKDLVAVPV
jgi:hypothetical protein